MCQQNERWANEIVCFLESDWSSNSKEMVMDEGSGTSSDRQAWWPRLRFQLTVALGRFPGFSFLTWDLQCFVLIALFKDRGANSIGMRLICCPINSVSPLLSILSVLFILIPIARQVLRWLVDWNTAWQAREGDSFFTLESGLGRSIAAGRPKQTQFEQQPIIPDGI